MLGTPVRNRHTIFKRPILMHPTLCDGDYLSFFSPVGDEMYYRSVGAALGSLVAVKSQTITALYHCRQKTEVRSSSWRCMADCGGQCTSSLHAKATNGLIESFAKLGFRKVECKNTYINTFQA